MNSLYTFGELILAFAIGAAFFSVIMLHNDEDQEDDDADETNIDFDIHKPPSKGKF